MQNGYAIGIDVGGTKVAYGLFDSDRHILDRYQHQANITAEGPEFSDQIIDTVMKIIKKNNVTIDELKGVGICMPSYILFEKGYIYITSSLTRIKDFAMRDYISRHLPVKIELDNDANGAALAEHRYGAGRGSRHMLYIATSTGIGSGIIINGELFRGSYGWAGECGHMLVTPDEGILCGCGNKGCIMSYASGRYAPKHVEARLAEGAKSILSRFENVDCTNILQAYNKNDPLAIETVISMAHYLAVCVFNIYQLLNINLFVFGGGLVNFSDALFGRIRTEFDRYNHLPQSVYFRFAELKKDLGIIGAAELVLG